MNDIMQKEFSIDIYSKYPTIRDINLDEECDGKLHELSITVSNEVYTIQNPNPGNRFWIAWDCYDGDLNLVGLSLYSIDVIEIDSPSSDLRGFFVKFNHLEASSCVTVWCEDSTNISCSDLIKQSYEKSTSYTKQLEKSAPQVEKVTRVPSDGKYVRYSVAVSGADDIQIEAPPASNLHAYLNHLENDIANKLDNVPLFDIVDGDIVPIKELSLDLIPECKKTLGYSINKTIADIDVSYTRGEPYALSIYFDDGSCHVLGSFEQGGALPIKGSVAFLRNSIISLKQTMVGKKLVGINNIRDFLNHPDFNICLHQNRFIFDADNIYSVDWVSASVFADITNFGSISIFDLTIKSKTYY